MDCVSCRELLSALLDDEVGQDEAREVQVHLQACEACRGVARDLEDLHRSLRVAAAPEVPDLTGAILAAIDERAATAQGRRVPLARTLLAAVGLAQLVVAVPVLLGLSGAGVPHLARELGAFGVALGLGLLAAAWQPSRAHGLLPMVGTLGLVVCAGALVDLAAGRAGLLAESTHLLQVSGVGLLWLLSRRTPRPSPTPAVA